MAGTGASSPFIKNEPDDQFFSSNQRFMGGSHQGFNIPQQHFNQFSPHSGSINPNDLAMGASGMPIQNGGYGQNNFTTQASNPTTNYSRAAFGDDELMESIGAMNGSHSNEGMQNNGADFGVEFDFNHQNIYASQNGTAPLSVDPNHMDGYSHTPDGDPIQSPFVHNFNQAQFRQMQQQHHFGSSLQSPASYTGSPIPGSEMQNGSLDNSYMGAKSRPRPNLMVQRKGSSTRSPLTPKTPAISSLNIGSGDHNSFQTQPIRTTHSHRHQKTLSGQWEQHTPGSLNSFPGSAEFSPPIQGVHPNPQISDILKGASMPNKMNGATAASAPALQSQEMKRRRRRESHNLVERRRRDNINERIQELSHLVPMHRLEDEKVRKALQNNSPLSPTLAATGMSPPQATSGLAGPGARRATAGNITTGIPLEEKDKGPNKGDILNGAVSWTRDLMWMLHVKLQQQEELANIINDLGGTFPFEQTEDERRMHTELMDAMLKNDPSSFQYSRAPGTGLRVPKHTDVKGDPIGGVTQSHIDDSVSPDNTGDSSQTGIGGPGQYWSGHNSGGSGAGSISFKEEDEFGMDLGA